MNDEQTQKIDAEIKRLLILPKENRTGLGRLYIEGIIHGLQWVRSNL